jgi:16S rRNA (guanine966-N2)-methyltransferase
MRIITGALKGRRLKTVADPGCRPAMGRTREALFSMLEARGMIWEGARALDLFAGTASLAFEAVSRGAEEAWCVEAEKKLADRIAENARLLDLADGRIRIWPERVEKFLRRSVPAPFDVIFVDPPYGADLLPATLRAVIRGEWLKEGGMLAAEIAAKDGFAASAAIRREAGGGAARLGRASATLQTPSSGFGTRTGGMLAAEVETGLNAPGETSLLTLMDRSYGQTRIVLWTLRKDVSPSTPAPSIP